MVRNPPEPPNYWDHRGLRMAYRSWGDASRPTVICLHGFLDTGAGFFPIAEALSDRWHVVVPDHRGHGHSGHVGMGGYYHFPDYLLDLDGLYAHLGIERAALLGHSMGASIACYFGGAFPERVWGMCLLDGIGPPDASERPSPPQRIARWIGEVRRREARTPTPLESLEKAAEAIKQVSTRATPETLLALAEQATRLSSDGDRFWRFDPLHRTQGAMAFQAEVFYRFLETIDCPVYALWAEHSPMHTPDEGRRLDALGESLAKVDTIPDTGHNLHHERPDEVAKRVRAFLETCPSP